MTPVGNARVEGEVDSHASVPWLVSRLLGEAGEEEEAWPLRLVPRGLGTPVLSAGGCLPSSEQRPGMGQGQVHLALPSSSYPVRCKRSLSRLLTRPTYRILERSGGWVCIQSFNCRGRGCESPVSSEVPLV